jgi:general stress protein 26
MWKPYKTYEEKGRDLVSSNKYMVVATSSKSGEPWAAPVFFANDDKYNFYFLSAVDSKHAKNILENPKVALIIFDSGSPIGQSDGLQIQAKAAVVGKKEIENVIKTYCDRLFPDSDVPATSRYDPEEYLEPSEFRFFKAEITDAFVTGVDRRVKVDLTKKD